ncbi:MAG TPA: DNA repair protein RecN, partial [Anaeromyxobacteraceae bacterium]|nr:DNA repair protein RecN [Anaeromyxobacteraceae bacterium]
VNGVLCTVAILESAMRGLVDVTGQHEHVSLLDPSTHLGLLDAFAGAAAPDGLLSRYRAAFDALSALVREERALAGDEGERARRADYLAFQIEELDAVDPRPGEDAALEQERKVLSGAARLADAAGAAEGLAYAGEGSAAERIGQAVRALQDAAGVDPRLDEPLALLRSAAAEVEEAGRTLARYAGSLEGNPERLAEVEERIAALRGLSRKHGGSLEAAIARRDEMRAELAGLTGAEGRRDEVARALAVQAQAAAALAAELSGQRRQAARAFCKAVSRELEALAMSRCRVEVSFSEPAGALEAAGHRLGAGGAESAEILIAPNPGEAARPLARVASGGELSRVLLAVKRALSRADPVRSYVFDEVDAGIGGAVAEAVGRALADVARDRQVVCVTHLPQVAAFAGLHARVEKRVAGGRTVTTVVPLEGDGERRAEIARMLAGHTVTASALEHAAALLAGARKAGEGAARRSPRALARPGRSRGETARA